MSVKEDVEAVLKVFPQAYCISYKDKYCVAWSFDTEPIIATGRHPHNAWRAAARLVKGKNKKQIEKLKRNLIKDEADKTQF